MKNVITSGRAYLFAAGLAFLGFAGVRAGELGSSKLDQELYNSLARQGFTGRVESTLAQRLGRPVDPAKAELGAFCSSISSLACMGITPVQVVIRH